ncbi:MAG: hypothetical protein K2L98_02235, partial [Bacilli bacterium]|nr:hypothetical protein [Bacilli bacterium]
MEMDFETLNLDYRIVEPDEEIDENEWKIAFLKDIGFVRGNYHFLRQGKDGIWYHKIGSFYDSIPSNKDHNDNIIIDPRT